MEPKNIMPEGEEIAKHGGDTLAIIVRKYGFNPLDKVIVQALMDAYQQGCIKTAEVMISIQKKNSEKLNKDLDEIAF